MDICLKNITIGKIKGGNNFNVIADEVNLAGTTRAYTEENRNLIKSRMEEIVHGTASTFGANITLNYRDGYPPTIKGTGIMGLIYRDKGGLIVNNGKRKAVRNSLLN